MRSARAAPAGDLPAMSGDVAKLQSLLGNLDAEVPASSPRRRALLAEAVRAASENLALARRSPIAAQDPPDAARTDGTAKPPAMIGSALAVCDAGERHLARLARVLAELDEAATGLRAPAFARRGGPDATMDRPADRWRPA